MKNSIFKITSVMAFFFLASSFAEDNAFYFVENGARWSSAQSNSQSYSKLISYIKNDIIKRFESSSSNVPKLESILFCGLSQNYNNLTIIGVLSQKQKNDGMIAYKNGDSSPTFLGKLNKFSSSNYFFFNTDAMPKNWDYTVFKNQWDTEEINSIKLGFPNEHSGPIEYSNCTKFPVR